jgi:hypothetical protein
VARTLNDYLQRPERANAKSVREARAVFDQACGVVRQIVELREKHGLTQIDSRRRPGSPRSRSAGSSEA